MYSVRLPVLFILILHLKLQLQQSNLASPSSQSSFYTVLQCLLTMPSHFHIFTFLEEYNSFLCSAATISHEFLITGDFNIHVNDALDSQSIAFSLMHDATFRNLLDNTRTCCYQNICYSGSPNSQHWLTDTVLSVRRACRHAEPSTSPLILPQTTPFSRAFAIGITSFSGAAPYIGFPKWVA